MYGRKSAEGVCPGGRGGKGEDEIGMPNAVEGGNKLAYADALAEDQGEDPATFRKKRSFYSNRKGRFYMLEWANFAEFDAWCWVEEATNMIEFCALTVWQSGTLWTCQCLFVCRHQSTGGGNYTKKNPKQKHKIESKKISCLCHLLIKIYPHTTTILGNYKKAHNHETGATNIKYMGILHDTWEHIRALLRDRVNWQQIVHEFYVFFCSRSDPICHHPSLRCAQFMTWCLCLAKIGTSCQNI
jgi:hypothetical protein